MNASFFCLFFLTNFRFRLPKSTFLIAKSILWQSKRSNLRSAIDILASENSLFGDPDRLTFK